MAFDRIISSAASGVESARQPVYVRQPEPTSRHESEHQEDDHKAQGTDGGGHFRAEVEDPRSGRFATTVSPKRPAPTVV
jgi:hypothetical protein